MSIENVKLDSFWTKFVQKVQQHRKLLWAMAAFWLVIALALCAVFFAVDGQPINGNVDPGLANPQTGNDPTSTTTDPPTKKVFKPIIGTIMLPGMTGKTDSPTGSTQPPAVGGAGTHSPQNATKIPPIVILPVNETIPTNVTALPTNVTKPSTGGTQPSATTTTPATGTTPPSTGTTPPPTGTTPPPTGTTPPTTGTTPTFTISPPIQPVNPQPPMPMPPTAWIYPGIFWPPMRQPSYSSSVDSFDQSMSDQSGDILIEDFKETITIHKKTIRKHQDKFNKANSDLSSSSEVDYNNF